MIKIIVVIDSYKYYKEPIEEFIKRLGKDIDIIKLKPSKKKEISEQIKEESNLILKELEKNKGYKILLDIEGIQYNTKNFKKFVFDNEMKYSNVIFVIGGAYGVDLSIMQNVLNSILSFSKMTFTHIEAFMILLEQIYRIYSIKKGNSYDH